MCVIRQVPREYNLLLTGLNHWLCIFEDPFASSNVFSNLPDNVPRLSVKSNASLIAHLVGTLDDWETSVNDLWIEGCFLLQQVDDELLEFSILDSVKNGLSALMKVSLSKQRLDRPVVIPPDVGE